MNGTKSQPGGPGGTAALEARIDRIRQTMSAQQARLARGSMLTASIGAILCVAMAIWFSIGYGMLRDMTTPKKIVGAAEAVVLESLPDARRALEAQINGSADEWAANISKQIQENIPGLRGHMEDFIVTKADEALDHVQVMTSERFRTFVSQNQPMLADGFRSLKKPDEAEQFVQDLGKAVESQMSGDIREQSEGMLHMVFDLNGKLEKLKSGEKLNAEQALEREILMIAKRLQRDSADDRPLVTIKKSTPQASPDDSKTEEPVAKANDSKKTKQQPKSDDKASNADKPAKSGEKSTDGDKPAPEKSKKKDDGEKSDAKETKSGDN